VVNATGPFTDEVRRNDDRSAAPMIIVLDQRFAPPSQGLLIPRTEGGRALFILPGKNRTLRVADLMAGELVWDAERRDAEAQAAAERLWARSEKDIPLRAP
jgi:hypothetical protein